MRSWLNVLAVVVALAVGSASPAHAEAPGTELSPDRFAVLAGSPDAPAQLEFFCDPQCPDCAKFEAASGTDIGNRLANGQLAVTYRWLTFLDAKKNNDISSRVSNALIAAADPATSATAYQAFVEDLYRHRDPNGAGPDVDAIAAMARESGLPEQVVDRIATGQPNVDVVAMNAVNRARLLQVNPEHPGTPTVYDARANTVVDTDEPGWLDRLANG